MREVPVPAARRTLAAGETSASGTPISGNKDNIQYHYDLSNAFYSLFLDPQMVYSCAYFTDWSNDIAQAQRDKLEMICRKLRLQAGRALSRHWLRLGRAGLPRRAELRRAARMA